MGSVPLRSHRWEEGPVRMGYELGSAEQIHKLLVHVELQIGDSITDFEDFISGLGRKQGYAGTFQGGVPERDIGLQREVGNHAYGDSRPGVDIGAEGPGDVEMAQLFHGDVHRVGDGG